MKIGISAPADLHALATHCGGKTEELARGLGSTATTPLIRHLVDRGHEVTLFTLSRDIRSEQRHCWGPLTVFVGPAKPRYFTRSLYKDEIGYLRGAIQGYGPKFVNAHWTYEFALGALAAGVPVLVTIHDLPWNVLRYFRDPHRAVRLGMAYAVAAQCRSYTAVSEDAARHFRRYMRPGSAIEVIPNFTDIEALHGAPIATGESGPVTFATVLQGWTRRKNPKPAMLAFQEIRSETPRARLWMIGEGYGNGGPAHAWAIDRGLADGISFLGLLPHREVLALMQTQVDVLVHPSLDEAFSMTMLEAMALGKPVIAGKATPGVREMIGSGSGLTCNVSDPHRVAEAMGMMLRDSDAREAMGAAGKKRVAERFSAGVVVPLYEEAYHRMAGE